MPLAESQRAKTLELLDHFKAGGLELEYQGKVYSDYREWDKARTAALVDMQKELRGYLRGNIELQGFKDLSRSNLLPLLKKDSRIFGPI